jgi:hypothetical protein
VTGSEHESKTRITWWHRLLRFLILLSAGICFSVALDKILSLDEREHLQEIQREALSAVASFRPWGIFHLYDDAYTQYDRQVVVKFLAASHKNDNRIRVKKNIDYNTPSCESGVSAYSLTVGKISEKECRDLVETFAVKNCRFADHGKLVWLFHWVGDDIGDFLYVTYDIFRDQGLVVGVIVLLQIMAGLGLLLIGWAKIADEQDYDRDSSGIGFCCLWRFSRFL